ncbi:hypothetical protein FRB94_005697 [Tulasnella sp. JGI-2019a]|nr:hypothetical protein FRB94_005697 [Tulasnella sp. JGI-2019a]
MPNANSPHLKRMYSQAKENITSQPEPNRGDLKHILNEVAQDDATQTDDHWPVIIPQTGANADRSAIPGHDSVLNQQGQGADVPEDNSTDDATFQVGSNHNEGMKEIDYKCMPPLTMAPHGDVDPELFLALGIPPTNRAMDRSRGRPKLIKPPGMSLDLCVGAHHETYIPTNIPDMPLSCTEPPRTNKVGRARTKPYRQYMEQLHGTPLSDENLVTRKPSRRKWVDRGKMLESYLQQLEQGRAFAPEEANS